MHAYAQARPGPEEDVRARILLVDDHRPNLTALEAILVPIEQELVTARSGEEALRKLLEGDFAVILMDVRMPGLDGIETASMIRKRERNRTTPIIFLTAHEKDPGHVFRGYSQGAVDYLVKPFDPDILRTKVSVLVDLWKKGELIKQQQALLRAQQLRELQRRNDVRFRAVIDSMPNCVWVADPNGAIAYCNRAWTEYAGPDAGTDFLEAVPEDEKEAVERAWLEAMASGRPFEREQRLRGSGGTWRWHLCRVVPEKDEHGIVVGWIVSATDIDQHKRVEEAHAALLAREQEARVQAETANRTKDEFLATVSHELRTPLNAILGWTRILRSGGTEVEAKLERALETIERNARAQTQLVEDILDVSRIIAGKLRIEVQRMDLARVILGAAEALKPSADARGIELEVRLPDSAPFEGDPDRVQQVVWNLVSNAIKFTPRGKVSVELRCEARHVELVVSDSGMGIKPAFLPHVFDRFRQADTSIARATGGLGLGLAIVRHLVEVHGGTVKAESEGEGKGACFTVRLPAPELHAQPEEHRPQRATPVHAGALAGVRVLVVDDDQDARELAVELLGLYGAEVVTAACADTAIELLRRCDIDVLVSDIGLPREDGFSLLRRVRALAETRRVPAVALTAFAAKQDGHRALEAGFQRHLTKPVEPVQLVSVIAELAPRPISRPALAESSAPATA